MHRKQRTCAPVFYYLQINAYDFTNTLYLFSETTAAITSICVLFNCNMSNTHLNSS